MSADELQILDRAVLADDGGKTNRALNASLFGQRRIDAASLCGSRLAACTLPPTRIRCGVTGLLFHFLGRRWRRGRRYAANDAANYAAADTTGNAARYATDYAG